MQLREIAKKYFALFLLFNRFEFCVPVVHAIRLRASTCGTVMFHSDVNVAVAATVAAAGGGGGAAASDSVVAVVAVIVEILFAVCALLSVVVWQWQ